MFTTSPSKPTRSVLDCASPLALFPRSCPPARKSNIVYRKSSAFTLIELVVVLVIIGIMSALIIPEMRGTHDDAILRSSARKLISVFNLANSRAIAVNQMCRVHLDRISGHYMVEHRVQGEDGPHFTEVRDLSGGAGEIDQRITVALHRPEEDTAEQPAGDGIRFYPDGTADASEIELRDRNGFQLALRVNPITARVSIIEPTIE